MNKEKIIISAIRNRRVLALRYHGYSRIVEPHMLGETKVGNLALSAWQTAGGSVSGEIPGWKILKLSEIVGLNPTGETFATWRYGYNPETKEMTNIRAKL